MPMRPDLGVVLGGAAMLLVLVPAAAAAPTDAPAQADDSLLSVLTDIRDTLQETNRLLGQVLQRLDALSMVGNNTTDAGNVSTGNVTDNTTENTTTVWLVNGSNSCRPEQVPPTVIIDPSFGSEQACLDFIEQCREQNETGGWCGVIPPENTSDVPR